MRLLYWRRRRLARRYAQRHGYFWLPCPLCGEHFGGHEWLHTSADFPASIYSPSDPPGLMRGICPACSGPVRLPARAAS